MEIRKSVGKIYTIHIKDNLLYVKQVNLFMKEFASCLKIKKTASRLQLSKLNSPTEVNFRSINYFPL